MTERPIVYIMSVIDAPEHPERILAWNAVAHYTDGHQDFEGPRDEAIEWARAQHPESIFIFDPEKGDYVPVDLSTQSD